LSLFGAGVVPSFLRRAAFATEQPGRKKILAAIFQRGAADGLNIVVPFGEKDYHTLRPTIAIPEPSKSSGAGPSALDLDGFFGLHRPRGFTIALPRVPGLRMYSARLFLAYG
jgi:uncharacterized protein (DUF1501 family)